MSRELDISEIQDEVSSANLREEATANRTIHTGAYNLQFQGVKVQENDAGQRSLSFNVAFMDQASGERKGSGFFNAAWESRYREGANGKYLEKDSKLYGQMLKVFDLPSGTGPKAVVDAFTNAMVGGFVTETLVSPEGVQPAKYLDVVNPETGDPKVDGATQKRIGDGKAIARKDMGSLVETGWRAKNYIQSISKAK